MWFVLAFSPAALYVAIVFPRMRSAGAHGDRRRAAFVSLLIGAVIALPIELVVRSLGNWLGVDAKSQITGGLASMLASLLVFAPLEEAGKAGSALALRQRFVRGPRDGLLVGSALALGFACVELGLLLRNTELRSWEGALLLLRAAFATAARVFAGSVWGYALGRARAVGAYRDKVLVSAWLGATTLRGLYDHLVFGRGLSALLGSLPLSAGMAIVAYLGMRELSPKVLPRFGQGRLSFLPSLPPPPSLRAMRDALRRAERPVMLHWIVLGALVNMGVIIACVVGAVLLGHRLGVDFGAVDEGDLTGAGPLSLIGFGVLLAFPSSGYLVARASGADSVLEAAMSTGLAIVGTLVMLGLAAPVAVVFALAFAPIALGLSCAGAWIAIGAGG